MDPIDALAVLRLVPELFQITKALEAAAPGRHFTPDGHLVGSIGEANPDEQQNSGVAAKRMNAYLRRNAVIKRIKDEASDAGEKATAYSFRHRYALASWDKKISANEIAFAMGQTIDVHLANYARFKPSGTAYSYRRAAED